MNAIVIGPRGSLRDGLVALLYAVPEVQVVSATEYASSVLDLVQEQSASLMLTQVGDSGNECSEWIEAIKAKSPATRILALVDDVDSIAPCLAGGVDRAFVEGGNTETLHRMIEELIHAP